MADLKKIPASKMLAPVNEMRYPVNYRDEW